MTRQPTVLLHHALLMSAAASSTTGLHASTHADSSVLHAVAPLHICAQRHAQHCLQQHCAACLPAGRPSCQALIVDEAHRLKNQKSATRLALQEMSIKWLLMLSGTPVQNNMKELQVSGEPGGTACRGIDMPACQAAVTVSSCTSTRCHHPETVRCLAPTVSRRSLLFPAAGNMDLTSELC
jgi:hypothetical protein